MAVRVATRLQRRFGGDLKLAALLEARTVRALAAVMRALTGDQPATSTTPKAPTGPAPWWRFRGRRFASVEPLSRPTTDPHGRCFRPPGLVDPATPVVPGSIFAGGAAYNVFAAFTLRGPLRPDLLEQSLNIVAARHESLRTAFTTADGVVSQVVQPTIHVPLEIVPWPQGARQALPTPALDARLNEEAAARFKLTEAPLVRAKLFVIDPADARLLRRLPPHHPGWLGPAAAVRRDGRRLQRAGRGPASRRCRRSRCSTATSRSGNRNRSRRTPTKPESPSGRNSSRAICLCSICRAIIRVRSSRPIAAERWTSR